MQQQTVTVVQTQTHLPDPCYKCCCPPCAWMSVEGCSPMAAVCWLACFFTWPINGFVACCIDPVPPQPPVAVVQPGHVVQPVAPVVVAQPVPVQPAGYPQPAGCPQPQPVGYPQPAGVQPTAPPPPAV